MTPALRAALAAPTLLALSICFSIPASAQSTPAQAGDETVDLIAEDRAMATPPPAAETATARVGRARPFETLIAGHASSNGVPAELVHRVILRESRYRADAIGRGGASGLMQIKFATARALGYGGTAAGLLDPDTNLTFGVRYLAGAYRAASGDHGRAVGYYASGYHHAAKRQRAPANAYARVVREPAFTAATSAKPAVQEHRGAKRNPR